MHNGLLVSVRYGTNKIVFVVMMYLNTFLKVFVFDDFKFKVFLMAWRNRFFIALRLSSGPFYNQTTRICLQYSGNYIAFLSNVCLSAQNTASLVKLIFLDEEPDENQSIKNSSLQAILKFCTTNQLLKVIVFVFKYCKTCICSKPVFSVPHSKTYLTCHVLHCPLISCSNVLMSIVLVFIVIYKVFKILSHSFFKEISTSFKI